MTSGARVAFVLKGWPRLSETFIAQEIEGLERRGLDLLLVSLRHPTDKATHPVHDRVRAVVNYLPEYLHDEPLRVLRGLRRSLGLPGFGVALRAWLRDLRRDPTRNRVRRFGQALVLGAELPASVRHLHAHFMHTPASVTRYAAQARQLPFTISAHAKDIYTSPEWEIREKLAECRWLVTCTAANESHLGALSPDANRVALQYHGLSLDRFASPPERADGGHHLDIVSVGRAVEKKGYDDLLAALASLPDDVSWHLTHVGGGPLLDALRARAVGLGIDACISWCGPLAQSEVLERLRAANVFALASRIGDDGDRDGLPNVLMEAQSQRLACVATDISGIPELIEHEATGLLVPQRDREALCAALTRLSRDPTLRNRLAEAGEARVREHFDAERELDTLHARFVATLGVDARE